MDNGVKVPKRNPSIESETSRLIAVARDKLEPYIDQQLRRNIKGIRTTEQEILLEIFKFFERKYRTERYGFIRPLAKIKRSNKIET